MKLLGWLVGLIGGAAGLLLVVAVVWFFEGWTRHFNPDASFGRDSWGFVVLGILMAAASITAGWLLVRAGRRRETRGR